MESIREIFRIGHGSSSSHTRWPFIAALIYKAKHPDVKSFKVILYGSLALTGKGHLEDVAIKNAFSPAEVEIVWKEEENKRFYPNALMFEVKDDNFKDDKWLVYSIGGGKIVEDKNKYSEPKRIYKLNYMQTILELCKKDKKRFYDIVFETEDKNIKKHLLDVGGAMKDSTRGIAKDGVLPVGLNFKRRAKSYYEKSAG